jgi:hypothetical protein
MASDASLHALTVKTGAGVPTLDIVLAVGGIVVTLVTFALGYRNLVSAKRERIRSTDQEIESTVLTRIVLGQWLPTFDDLMRFVEGKAIGADVDVADLRSVQDLVKLLWMRVVENDLIPLDRRGDILANVFPIERLARETSPAPVTERTISEQRHRSSIVSPTVLLGFASAVLGTLVAASVPLIENGAGGVPNTLVYFGVAVAIMAPLVIVLIYRSEPAHYSAPDKREIEQLTTYPDKDVGLEALSQLRHLSPLAISGLTSLANDEERCAREGRESERGLFVRRGGTPWHTELVDAGLAEKHEPPPGLDARGRDFLALTDGGKTVARLILTKEEPPDWLKHALERP